MSIFKGNGDGISFKISSFIFIPEITPNSFSSAISINLKKSEKYFSESLSVGHKFSLSSHSNFKSSYVT